MSKISIMGMKINLDFEKQTMSRGVLDILGSGLKDYQEKDVLLLSLKECMAKIAKGNKLPYKAANYLLVNILNSLSLDGSDVSEEIAHSPVTDSQPEDHSQSENDDVIHGSHLGASGSASNPRAAEPPNTNQASVKEAGDKSPNKKRTCVGFMPEVIAQRKGTAVLIIPQSVKCSGNLVTRLKTQKAVMESVKHFILTFVIALHGTGPAHGLSAGSST